MLENKGKQEAKWAGETKWDHFGMTSLENHRVSRRYSRTMNKNVRREADIGVQDVEAVSKQLQVVAEAGNRRSLPQEHR